MEPVETRLARIEETCVAMRGELKLYHHLSESRIGALEKKSDGHHDKIVVLARDRYWMFLLVGGLFTTAIAVAGIHYGVR